MLNDDKRKPRYYILKQGILTGLCLFIISAANVIATTYEPIDKVITIVDNDVIFASELARRIQPVIQRLRAQGQTYNQEQLQQQILDSLILERLQLSIAKKNKIRISTEEVDQALNILRNNIERQGIAFDKYLSSQSLTINSIRKDIKRKLTIEKIQKGVLNQRVKVTEREVENFLNSKSGQEWLTPKFHVGHILLADTTKNKSELRAQAENIYHSLAKAKNNFKTLAAKYSQGPNASRGGDLGLRKEEDLPELFVQQLQTLRPGSFTKPFSSSAGIHILMLFNRSGAEPVIVTQNKVRHILVAVTDLFTDADAQKKINDIYQQLRQGKDFSTLAQEYTDDTGSKRNGGDLGWSNPGQFVPAFEKVVRNATIGRISSPFRSAFGWHIARVEDRRKKDIFDSVKRIEAAKLLRQQRFQDELQIWLQELRDNAYIEKLI